MYYSSLTTHALTYAISWKTTMHYLFILSVGIIQLTSGLKSKDVNKSKWMTELRPVIGDKKLGDLILPGTHDSGTSGITKDSYLIDRSFLFQIGEIVVPQVLVNWSRTQDQELGAQLHAGYRVFDLRIVDVLRFNDTFRWWHGLSGDKIFAGLQQIRDFALENPGEVLILEFDHFVAPSDSGTISMPNYRKDELAEILLEYLGIVGVPNSELSNNPTLNEVLATGRNVIIEIGDVYISEKSNLFWHEAVHHAWQGRTNPEDLFEERSSRLAEFKENYSDSITVISSCATPDEVTIAAAMLQAYGDNPLIGIILEMLLPGVAALEVDLMSFEGVYVDLLSQSRFGVNTGGMYVRPEASYTNGASVQYRGVDEQVIYWLGRPNIYKPNIISVNDFITSNIVDVALRANLNEIPRQCSVSFQGNTQDGFYEWIDYQAVGGANGHACNNVKVKYHVEVNEKVIFQQAVDPTPANKWTAVFGEGDFPVEARIVVEVETADERWVVMYNGNVQEMIVSSLDVYIRGSGLDVGHGFVYTSYQYDLFGRDCVTPPSDGYIEMISW